MVAGECAFRVPENVDLASESAPGVPEQVIMPREGAPGVPEGSGVRFPGPAG